MEASVVSRVPCTLPKAVLLSNYDLLCSLLEKEDVDLLQKDEEGATAFHRAAQYGEIDMLCKLLEHPKAVEGANAKAGLRRTTPLHAAAQAGAIDAIHALLSHPTVRVDVNAVNQWGETALFLAAHQGDFQTVVALLRKEASVQITDRWGTTPSQAARDYGEYELAEMLSKYEELIGISVPQASDERPSIFEKAQLKVSSVEELLEFMDGLTLRRGFQGSESTSKTTLVLSKLMEAPLNDSKFAEWLSNDSIDVNGKDFYGYSAAHKLAAWNRPKSLRNLTKHPKFCLSPGSTGVAGSTPFHLACEVGAHRCVEVLLHYCESQATVSDVLNLTNNTGQTALDLALLSGNPQLVALLELYGAEKGEQERAEQHQSSVCDAPAMPPKKLNLGAFTSLAAALGGRVSE